MKTLAELNCIAAEMGIFLIDNTDCMAERVCVLALIKSAMDDTITRLTMEKLNQVRLK